MRDEREIEATRRQHLIAFGRIEANSVEFSPDQTRPDGTDAAVPSG
jgi:hypothetical protein